jgi:uncharacterized circularly permuted ATP-grasp superfamily protein/uncharacterized alpha-E superfamily protein
MERTWQRAQEMIAEQGLHVGTLTGGVQQSEHLPIDLFPYVIGATEWRHLQAGVAQRIRAWNAFLKDIYTSQEILKAGVVPFELIYEDPRYQRPCMNVPVMRNIFLNVTAVDLIRDQAGQWLVLDDHVANPSGAAYALQARRVLSQVSPELMEGQTVAPVHTYPTQLLETLQYVAPNGALAARAVLLTRGIEDETFYDHSLLARQMGIPLVQSGDLIVLDGELYLKTISGLEKVDVIYRRLHTESIDPVSFHTESRGGVAGLLSCVRNGTVSVANALGSGLIENRGLAVFLPKMVEFYLNEKTLLPPVPARLCSDVDVCEDVLDHLDRYVIRPTRQLPGEDGWVGSSLTEGQAKEIRHKLTKYGSRYVAQSLVEVADHPTWRAGLGEAAPVSLRLFALHGASIQVTPCALAMMTRLDGAEGVYKLRELGVKDTWILVDSHQPAPLGPLEMVTRTSNRRMRLGSRAADCLFWIGRYAERCEATIVVLRVIQQLRLEGNTHQRPSSWNPLWEALANATGHPTSFFKRSSFRHAAALAQYVLFDAANLSSAYACAKACRQNAQQVREAISPEVWNALNSLYTTFEEAAENPSSEPVQDQIESMELHDKLLRQLYELTGCVEKHMLHNDAWNFWQIGRHLERALFSIFTMRQVFLKLQNERTEGAGYCADTINLDALLRMLSGLYAYRSSYLTRPNACLVAKLLLQGEDFPRSVAFCLAGVRRALRNCFGERPDNHSAHLLHQCDNLLSELFLTDVRQFFSLQENSSAATPPLSRDSAGPQNLADWLDSLSKRMLSMGTLMADFYVDQQARVVENT